MHTIYKGESEPITLSLFAYGQATDATGTPVLVIKDTAGTTLLTPTVTKTEVGEYYAEIPWTLTNSSPRPLKAEWTYTLDGATGTRVEWYNVITPYVSFKQILGVSPADTSYEEMKAAETYARFAIDAYCSQVFHPYQDDIFAYGQGKDVLSLTKRILSLDKISVQGETYYDDTTNEWGQPIEISNTNKAIRLMGDPDDDIPGWSASGIFSNSVRYDVSGTFGWEQVPGEISAAALLLVNDFFCKEAPWRNKFVTSISASDWRVVFNAEAQRGTGNATADRILDPFVSNNWIVI
jgi:hypothetical protein